MSLQERQQGIFYLPFDADGLRDGAYAEGSERGSLGARLPGDAPQAGACVALTLAMRPLSAQEDT
jgi:hypothetical protein